MTSKAKCKNGETIKLNILLIIINENMLSK